MGGEARTGDHRCDRCNRDHRANENTRRESIDVRRQRCARSAGRASQTDRCPPYRSSARSSLIQIDCKSAAALGCTTFDARADCNCGSGCNRRTRRTEWAANPRLQVGPITVRFSTDCYDTGRIIMEEERHVAAYQDAIHEAERRTAQLNGRAYGSKAECEGACRQWVQDVQSIIQSPWRNGWIDFTHPVRRCDGSIPWI
jgi:hypothetical protein